MNHFHMLIRPSSIRAVVTSPRFGKPQKFWTLNGVHMEVGEIAPDAAYARQVAHVQFTVHAHVGLYLPLATLSSAFDDIRKGAAIKRYISIGFIQDARHHLRHWWDATALRSYVLVVTPEWIK